MSHHGEGDNRLGMFEWRNLDFSTADIVDPLVINTWYEALPLTRNIKMLYCQVEQTNNGAAPEDLEVEFTIDGAVINRALPGEVSGATNYMIVNTLRQLLGSGPAARMILANDPDQAAPLETRSLRIKVRQTSAVDLVSAFIEVNANYFTLERTT